MSGSSLCRPRATSSLHGDAAPPPPPPPPRHPAPLPAHPPPLPQQRPRPAAPSALLGGSHTCLSLPRAAAASLTPPAPSSAWSPVSSSRAKRRRRWTATERPASPPHPFSWLPAAAVSRWTLLDPAPVRLTAAAALRQQPTAAPTTQTDPQAYQPTTASHLCGAWRLRPPFCSRTAASYRCAPNLPTTGLISCAAWGPLSAAWTRSNNTRWAGLAWLLALVAPWKELWWMLLVEPIPAPPDYLCASARSLHCLLPPSPHLQAPWGYRLLESLTPRGRGFSLGVRNPCHAGSGSGSCRDAGCTGQHPPAAWRK